MSIAELVETYISVGDKIDTLWNMFIFLHLGVLGYAMSTQVATIKTTHKILGCAGYLFFSYVNYNALIDSYHFANSVLADIRDAMKVVPNAHAAHLQSFFDLYRLDGRDAIVFMIHAIALIAVIYLLLQGTNFAWRKKRFGRSDEEVENIGI